MQEENKINVFISYSWDDSEHQKWVITLADLIEDKGGNAIVDRNNLKYGGHIKSFMWSSIIDSDIVLIILTPNYKRKADAYEGGAGYEYNIINDDLFKIIKKNEKYIPIIRKGDLRSSATNFLQGFNCLDLRDGEDYDENLKRLIKQIFEPTALTQSKSSVKANNMDTTYKDIDRVSSEIITKSRKYFVDMFVSNDRDQTRKMLVDMQKIFEKEINSYHESFMTHFNPRKMIAHEDYLEAFKYTEFAKNLWTVAAALKTPDPDLARYKKDFRNADNEEIYDTVDRILKAAHHYSKEVATTIDYANLKNESSLKLDFLNEKGMNMIKIIGFGIRSEILHRCDPAFFPIMTQKSLWAMYFICDSETEFITIENHGRPKKMRVSHNWQYPYSRFTFLMNVIATELFKWFKEYGIELSYALRFGYVNMFLTSISSLHSNDIKLLHEWVDAK
jgi:hypothetical protein